MTSANHRRVLVVVVSFLASLVGSSQQQRMAKLADDEKSDSGSESEKESESESECGRESERTANREVNRRNNKPTTSLCVSGS